VSNTCCSFQLWEDAQLENIRLRDDLAKVRDDLKATQRKLDEAISVSFGVATFHLTAFARKTFFSEWYFSFF
jgi:hypothetical protein